MKKRFIALLLVCLFVACLASCGPTAEEKAQMEQQKEWEAQVDEVRPLIEEYLGIWEADVSVRQISGVIYATVTVTEKEATSSQFGTIISLLGNGFVEVAADYSDYAFGDMTFYYYYTKVSGKREDSPSLSYDVGPDGTGTFMYLGKSSALHNVTPDEVSEELHK